MSNVARALAVLALLATFALAFARESGPPDPGLDSYPPIIRRR